MDSLEMDSRGGPPPLSIVDVAIIATSNVSSWMVVATATTSLDSTEDEASSLQDNKLTPTAYENPYVLPWWQQVTWTMAFALMICVSVVGNAVVIWAVMCHRLMRSPTNYFLVNVSVADLMMTTLNGIFNFIYMLHSHWPFGKMCCTLSNFVANLTVAASVFSLVAISCDRYTAIMKPLRPRMTKRVAVIAILVIWMAGGLLSLPNLLYSTVFSYQYEDHTMRHLCTLKWPDGPSVFSKQDYAYNIVFAVMTYLLPMVSMLILYVQMGRELWGSTVIGECRERQIGSIKTKRRVVLMFIVVVVIFALCWLPYHVYFIYIPLNADVISSGIIQHIYLTFYWLAMSNAMYNPIIYFKMNSRFRQYFLTALCCGWKTTTGQVSNGSYGGHSGTQQGGGGGLHSTSERQTIIMRKLTEKNKKGGGSTNGHSDVHQSVAANGHSRQIKRNGTLSTSNGSCNGYVAPLNRKNSSSKFTTFYGQPPDTDVIL